MALRLVNRTLCRSTAPWLFRHIDARCSSSGRTPSLERISQLAESPYSVNVLQIDIGFRSDVDPGFLSNSPDALYIENLFKSLKSALVKFENLGALEFHEPHINLSKEEKIRYSDEVAFILGYVRLPKLQELVVEFSITHHFSRFFSSQIGPAEIHIGTVLKRLRYLGLYAREDTNQDEFMRQAPGRQIPPEYNAFRHTTQMFQMIQMAPNIQSLSTNSVNILNIDVHAFPSSLRLRSLDLTGISSSSEKIIALIDQSAETISYINFSRVYLYTWTWRGIFLHMCRLPHLLDIVLESSGYFPSERSSEMIPAQFPRKRSKTIEPKDIESNDVRDFEALGNLQRQINVNRVACGLQPFTDSEYRHINRAPYEPLLLSYNG